MKAEVRRLGEQEEFFTEERCYIRECWNEGAAPQFSLARARVAAHVATQSHYLDSDEHYIVIEGHALVELDGVTHRVGPGDVVVIPRGTHQRVINESDRDFIFYCVCSPRFQPELYHPVTGS